MAKRYFRKSVHIPDEIDAKMRGNYLDLEPGQRISGVLEFRQDSRWPFHNKAEVLVEEDIP